MDVLPLTSNTTANKEMPKIHLFLTGHPGVGKTTIIKNTIKEILSLNEKRSSKSEDEKVIKVQGFYTEECRDNLGNRVGFDIIHDLMKKHEDEKNEMMHESEEKQNLKIGYRTKRDPLSRLGKPRKGDAAVGKYIVDTKSVAETAVPSIYIDPDNENKEIQPTLIVIDEFGKMELLCDSFLPAVQQTFERCTSNNHYGINSQKKQYNPCMILGTIPTPRYGRVIPAVENIVRAKSDVIVLHVTKMNRDTLQSIVTQTVVSLLLQSNHDKSSYANCNQIEALEPFLYHRPIGAPSMTPKTNAIKTNNHIASTTDHPNSNNSEFHSHQLSPPLSCGPLIHDSIPPRVIILGETASPKPSIFYSETEYGERSFWSIFTHSSWNFVNSDYKSSYSFLNPNVNISSRQPMSVLLEKKQKYIDLKNSVLSQGIGFWDVISNPHEKKKNPSGTDSRNKRRRGDANGVPQTPNNIKELLSQYESIVALAFIGTKARNAFEKHFQIEACVTQTNSLASRNIELLVLPSSSRANTHMSLDEKSDRWKSELNRFLRK